MREILVLCIIATSWLFGNTVTAIGVTQTASGQKVEVQITPAAVVEKTVVSSDKNSSEVDFKTDLTTTVYFLIDTSIPMKESFFGGIKPLLVELEKLKEPKEKWIVSYFDDDLHAVYDDDHNKTGIMNTLLSTIPVKGNRTELWRNTQAALKDLATRSSQRKILVLLSDGDAEDTTAYTREDVVKIAKDAHIRIVSLGYRDTMGTQNLRKIAEDTGGSFWKADKAAHQLPSEFFRALTTLIRSHGIVTIPSMMLHPTQSGKQDLNITFAHTGGESRLSLSVDTQKIAPPTPKPKITPKPIVKVPAKSDSELFIERYKVYLGIAAALLLLGLLFLLLRKKKTPPAKEAAGDVEPLGNVTREGSEGGNPTMIHRGELLAYFESLDGMRYDVYKFPSVIGKNSSNDVVIVGQYISRQHATITQNNGNYFIVDNNSSNGTKVNGKNINAPTRISEGAKVSFGPYETIFHTPAHGNAPAVNEDSQKTVWNR